MKLASTYKVIGKDPKAVAGETKNFKQLDLSRAELAAAISQGWPFCAQHRAPRRSANFVCSGFLAVDVDNGLRIHDVLSDPYFKQYGALMYCTASHTEDQHRFRLVFELEKPITEAAAMTAALTGLAYRFKGDMAATDACRVFFGNPGCEVKLLDGLLPHTEVEKLVALAAEKAAALKLRTKAGSIGRVRSRVSLPLNAQVRTGDGQEHSLWELEPGTRVYCPNHADNHPSAFVVRSRGGKPGVSCSACLVTLFPDGTTEANDDAGEFGRSLSEIVRDVAASAPGASVYANATVRTVHERFFSEPDMPPERVRDLQGSLLAEVGDVG